MLMRTGLRQWWFPFAVFAIALASTAVVAVQMQRAANVQDHERFEVAIDRLQDSIRDRIDMYVAMLRAGAGLLAATDLRSPEQFRAFVERLELPERYPGAQGIGYTSRIPAEELDRITAAQKKVGNAGFRVWPADPRPEYHSILYLEPLDQRNRAAIGYDMFTESTRRMAMERARDSGEPAASGPVTLVQEIDEHKQPGFLIYMPVYRGAAVPTTVEERRRQLRGFVYSPFRAGDLFGGILGRNPRPRAGFSLFDGTPSAGGFLHRTAVDGDTGRLTARRDIPVAGRTWTAEVFSTPALERSSIAAFVPLVIWGGGAITVLLTGLAVLQTRARRRAEQSEIAADEASRRFQQLANAIPQLAWMAKPDGSVYWYNERWYEYTGTTPDQMHGWGWQQVHEPSELPNVLERWKHSLQTGEPFEMEFPLRGADGIFRLFLTRVVPFRDTTGSIVHWFGTNTDVQYRRDAERSLREHTETLEILNRTGAQVAGELELDRLVQGVTDAGTRLTRAQFGAFFYNKINEQGESYTLYTLSGVPREAFAQFPMPRNTAVFGPTFRGEGIFRSGDITADVRYGRNAPHHGMPPGHLPVRSYLAAPVKSRSGEVLGGLFFGHSDRDVFTEQTEDIIAGMTAQAAIAIDNARLYGQVQQLLTRERTAREEAERVGRLKDEFLATLSHELRTPLNAVVGWAHILSSGTLTENKRQVAIDTILRNARIQSRLIEDLLDMSRIISGRVRIETSVVSVRDVIEAALNVVRPTAAAKRVELLVNIEPGFHAVKGDNNRLQQIVWNLLTNAIKFTPAGGSVAVVLARRDDNIEISVADTGIGIDPEFLPHVFERFRQADGSFTRGHGGLGLGLSIVHSLVEMHAGLIRASSAGLNRGATFSVHLPAAPDADLVAAGYHKPRRTKAPEGPLLESLAILVVDNDADAGDLAREILTHSGARVFTARSGAEALRLLHTDGTTVNLIVSDLGMPQMDGYEFIRRVRALPPEMGGSAPAIALTAYAGTEDQMRAMAAGYAVHLAKPFTPTDLVEACAALRSAGAP